MRFFSPLVALWRRPASFALAIAIIGAPVTLVALAGCGGSSGGNSLSAASGDSAESRAVGLPSRKPTGVQY